MQGISYIRTYAIFGVELKTNSIPLYQIGDFFLTFCSSTVAIDDDTRNAWSKSHWNAYAGPKY